VLILVIALGGVFLALLVGSLLSWARTAERVDTTPPDLRRAGDPPPGPGGSPVRFLPPPS
jgi:hypothetical protein